MLTKRFNIKMLVSALVLIATVWVSAYAALRSGSWSLNPADFRYDMSLYFALADKSLEDLDTYEIGAFVDDECRGVAEKLTLSDTESCLYMRIRSNSAQGANVEFRIRERGADSYVVLKPENGADFIFKSNDRVGMPSSPFMMTRYFNVEVSAGEHGSVDFTDGLYKEGSQLTLRAVADEGYRFTEWSDGDREAVRTLTVTGDLSLKASFDVNTYKVTFNIEGQEFVVVEVPFGSPITLPEAPARIGYTFDGWTDVPETMPAHDLVFDAGYSINSYKAVFKVDGAEVASYDVEYGAPVPTPAIPEKTGYTFNGWGDLPATMPAHDIEMHSSYSIRLYQLTFVIDGETILSSEVAYGAAIVAPEAPAKDGMTFAGWTDLPETMPAQDLTVTGTYKENSYKLTFKIADEVILSAELPFGAAIQAPEAPAKEGYSFAGWGEHPATMPAHDLEITGSYSVNSYVLTFVIDGETILTSELAFGASIVAPEAPAKEGYSFKGWGEVPATMPANDVTVSGSYAINTYKVTFRIDGEVILSSELEYGAAIKAPEAPAKEGYTFAGWSECPEAVPAHDVDVLGSYSVNSYKLSFSIGSEVLFSGELPFGASIVAPEAPAKEGYTFSGWGEVPATMPASDLAFTGSYEAQAYNVVYKLDGEVAYTAQAKFGDSVPAFEAPAKEGYTFSGWGEVPATMPAQDIEINGSYSVNSYAIIFRIGEDLIFEGMLPFGTEVTAPEAPAKEGYSFDGWKGAPATMPAGNVIVEGSYSINSYTITFKIGDEIFYTAQLEYGAPIEAPEAPEQEGHTFSGWGDVPATMPAFDLVFGGTYAENFYTVTFRIDGVTLFTDDIEYGDPIVAPEAPAKEGYSFNGWGEVPETMPAYNLEFDGSYKVNSYKISFRIGDEVIFSGVLPFGAAVTAPEVAAKEGHTFSGWGVVPATMPASDLEITGSYEVNSYNITFMVDGVAFYSTTAAYGSELTAPEAPAKEGHSFTGWSNLPATMPAYDLVIDGTYSVNSYNLAFRIGDDVVFEGLIPYGSEITAPEAPAREGHTFAGWGMVPATMPASDLVIEGSYNVNVYTLTFAIDGVAFSTVQMPYGAEIAAPTAPEKEGYSFMGWSNVPAAMPAADLVINGTYSVNSYSLVFRIGEDVIFEGQMAYGAEITAPEAPAKEGHSFAGWGMVPATMPASDLVIEGSYDVNAYNLTFRIDDQDFYTVQVPYGSAVTAPEAPAKEGYSFTGWSNLPETMPASDLVVAGTYEVNHYSLVFRIGEDVIFEGKMPYGSEIVAPVAPDRIGLTFAGWGMVPATMPASDLVIEGSYDVNVYTLTFDIDGEVFFQTQLAYGTSITVPAEVPDKEGNTFGGWGNVPETMPANDLTISGTYAPNHYTVTFSVDGDVIFTGEQPFGSEIVVPEVPEKEGYTFSGFGDVPATVPASNVVFTGSYVANVYKLVFAIDGEVIYSKEVAFGEVVAAPAAPEKEGHTFMGWGVVPATMPASDLHFDGSYEVNYYDVVFRIGEEIVSTARVAYGSEIAVPEAPAKEGHTFTGWGQIPASMPAQDMEFTGGFTVNRYQLSFMIGEEVIFTAEVPFGEAIEAPAAPEKEGYSFTGWGVVPVTMPASDLVITGAYDINYYSIIFRIGEEVVYSAQLPYGAEIAAPAAPEKEGHTFSGWGDVPSVMPASDLEFNGAYTANKYQLTFMIGEEVIYSAEVAYGDAIEVPAAPEKEGYSFTGWGVVPSVMPASDLVITGAYDINYYSIVFRIGEEVFHSAQLPYGAEIAAPVAPEREGYTFTGWGEVPATMPAADLEFTGSYDVNYYTVVFSIDGEVISEAKVAYGDAIEVPVVADREGFTFSGWGVVPAAMPAQDLAFNGAFEVNYYTVTFKINDNVAYTAQLPYGAPIVAPAAPEQEGCTFSGWSEFPETMPAHDVEVTATLTPNLYKLTVYVNDELYLEEELPFGAEIVIEEPTVQDGYEFKGWDIEIPATMPAHDLVINGKIEKLPTVGVAGLDADQEVSIFSVDGILLHRNVKVSEIKERLTPGVYIVNGKKMILK